MAPARFLTDTSLDLLARRLRFLGYDVRTLHGARLEDLFEVAREQQRIVLTLSGRHPKRWQEVTTLQVPRGDPQAGVRMIAAEYEAASLPFSRCPRCNEALQKRHPVEARGEVPGRVLRSVRSVQYCPMCGKWFWFGSHVSRMMEWLSGVVGRAVEWPHDPPNDDLVKPV